MNIGLYCKGRREALGLTQEDVASKIDLGFQVSLLWDFENGDEGDIDGWPIADICKYFRILGIPLTDLADIAIKDCTELPLDELVRRRREETGIAVDELNELIGYESGVVEEIEQGESIGALHILKELSAALSIPYRVLLEKAAERNL